MAEQAKTKPALTKLEIENEALRALTVKLGRIVLASADRQSYDTDTVRMPIFGMRTPDQIASALRELSLECERLVRISEKSDFVEDFEAIGLEFADTAARIEAAFRIPAVLR